MGHNYIGHNYIGHDYVGHDYIGHKYIGHKVQEPVPLAMQQSAQRSRAAVSATPGSSNGSVLAP